MSIIISHETFYLQDNIIDLLQSASDDASVQVTNVPSKNSLIECIKKIYFWKEVRKCHKFFIKSLINAKKLWLLALAFGIVQKEEINMFNYMCMPKSDEDEYYSEYITTIKNFVSKIDNKIYIINSQDNSVNHNFLKYAVIWKEQYLRLKTVEKKYYVVFNLWLTAINSININYNSKNIKLINKLFYNDTD